MIIIHDVDDQSPGEDARQQAPVLVTSMLKRRPVAISSAKPLRN
jgi:hypothetical protein